MDSDNIILSPKHSSNLELTVCDYIVATTLDLVSLQVKSCKKNIYIPNSIEINLPNLQESGYINANKATTLNLPNLQEAEDIFARNATKINLPNLQKARNIFAGNATTLNLQNLQDAGFIYANNAKKIIIPSHLKAKLKTYPKDCEITEV